MSDSEFSIQRQFDSICDEFDSQWSAGMRPDLEAYLAKVPESSRPALALLLIEIDVEYRRGAGGEPVVGDYPKFIVVDQPAQVKQLIDQNSDVIRKRTADKFAPTLSIASYFTETRTPRNQTAHDRDTARKKIGRYTVIKRIGKGGQGEVFLAEHPSLQGLDQDGVMVPLKVAIKIGSRRASESEQDMLRRESSMLCSLEHQYIARVRDLEFDDGVPFLVMEYVSGESLASQIQKQSMNHRCAVDVVIKIARAIQSAHDRKILHRDLKPANVLMKPNGDPAVIDFGLAAMRSSVSGQIQGSVPGGTIPYMAPEQAMALRSAWTGEPVDNHQEEDARGDVFSLGAILYRLLTGKCLYEFSDPLTCLNMAVDRKMNESLLDTSEAPGYVRSACLRALASDREDRFASAGEFADALERKTSRRSVIAALFVTLMAGGALFFGGFWYVTQPLGADRGIESLETDLRSPVLENKSAPAFEFVSEAKSTTLNVKSDDIDLVISNISEERNDDGYVFTRSSDGQFLIAPTASAHRLPSLDLVLMNRSESVVVFSQVKLKVAESKRNSWPELSVPKTIDLSDSVFNMAEESSSQFSGSQRFDPHFEIQNDGWGDVRDCRIQYEVVSDGNVLLNDSMEVGNFNEKFEINLSPILEKVGVNLDRIRFSEATYHPTWNRWKFKLASGEEIWEKQFVKRVQNGFGPVKEGKFQLRGKISFTGTTVDGEQKTSAFDFQTNCRLFDLFIIRDISPKSRMEPSAKFNADLRLEGPDYEIIIPTAQRIHPGDADRYTLVMAASESSVHRFRIELHQPDGSIIESDEIQLNLHIGRALARRLESMR